MVSRPRSQRPMPSSAGRSLPARLLAFIAARCAAPMASVPISAVTPLLVQLRLARSLPEQLLPEPVTMAQATAVGAAAGEVGAGIVLSTPQPPVWAAMVSVWALPAATRPLTIRPAGTNFARLLALFLGPTVQLSDWRSKEPTRASM